MARKSLVPAGGIAVLLMLGLSVRTVGGMFPTYVDGCDQCHGSFLDGTSPAGTQFPFDSKHEMHRNTSAMDTECTLCHFTPGDSPFTFISGGTPKNPGIGCTGCHGRFYSSVGDSSVGLRAHHAAAGIEICAGCHLEEPPPRPESVLATYYGSDDTNVNDPCNGSGLENWSIGDTLGLDNDGDDIYDQEDPDCAPCPGDLNGDGNVAIEDLLQLLSVWGPCPGCPADFDGDNSVGINDLLELLATWGTC